MICFFCKGTIADGFYNFTANTGSSVIVVKNVPAYICGQCGEVSYSDEVAKQLDVIIKQITSTVKTEVAVVSYSDKAA